MTDEKRIPKHIINKLGQIHRHQLAVKRLIHDIESWRPALTEKYDESHWTFAMHVDQQGSLSEVSEMEALLHSFLKQPDE